MSTVLLWLTLLMLAFLLAKIMYTDIRYRCISNIDIIFVLFCVVFTNFQENQDLSYQSAGLIFLVGLLLWQLRLCGAGDIKLIAVLALGVDEQWFLLCVVFMLLMGGALGIFLWVWARVTKSQSLLMNGVPYGVPIVISFSCGLLLTQLPN